MKRSACLLLIMILSLPVPSSAADQSVHADVIVYGATPGGFCAAIAAAREGASVILLEPTNHIGGVNTGGLSFSDSNQTVRSTVMGLFDEWHRRIEADYNSRGVQLPYQVSIKDHTHWTYEPHVAARVTEQMLREAKVRVFPDRVLHKVIKQAEHITALETSQETFTANVFIDGTYEGDLMAATGVSWTIGRESREDYNESLAGKRYPKRKMNFSGFDDQGHLLPFITTSETGDEAAGDSNVMTYSFRLCLTAEPENRVPMPAPRNYDPARFEAIRRHLKQGGKGVSIDLYPLPGKKFDGNNSIGGQFSLGLVGACNGWSEASSTEREKIWEEHRQYTLEFYHFLTTDPAVPEPTRQKFARLGLCKDEFPQHDHFPPQLYVREGRRMLGSYVIRQQDILDSPEKQDPIAVSSFPIDSHDCQRIALEDGVINEGTIFPVRMQGRRHGYPYHIPYRSILPQQTECNNLLVPVALSCTHVAISSIRVEPTWMIIGQSAGIAAAMAAKEQKHVQELAYPQLRDRLLAQNQQLDLPELPALPATSATGPVSIDPQSLAGIVLDDANADLSQNWSHSTNFKPYINRGYIHDDRRADGRSVATFRFKAKQTGRYQLLMAYSAHETRASNVPVKVVNGTSSTEFKVNQRTPLPRGEHFHPIGVVELKEGIETTITISNQNTNGFVILDAFQLKPLQ